MCDRVVNEIVESFVRGDGVYVITVHSFTKDDMPMYEDGMRKALKDKSEATEVVYLDFGGIDSLRELDERSLFDMFQFISFNCLRQGDVRINWGRCVLDYLKNYTCDKGVMWKLSGTTIRKLINADGVV
jgi:hypothetical protein